MKVFRSCGLKAAMIAAAMLLLGSPVTYAQQTPDHIVKFGPGPQPPLVDSVITEDPMSGNIGIGTTTPAAALHVNGDLRVETGYSQSSTGNFAVDAPFLPGGRLSILENGNLGIGWAFPNRKLTLFNSGPTTQVFQNFTGC